MASNKVPNISGVCMQLRFEPSLTADEYVRFQAWHSARLPFCPMHPNGGCSIARHGTYGRLKPAGIRIARWYCPQGHRTFSLLPDFLAAHLPGSLEDLERVVVQVEQSGTSIEAVADSLRAADDITLASAVRWVRRRIVYVRTALICIADAIPSLHWPYPPSLTALRSHDVTPWLLPQLRALASNMLPMLPPPLGFASFQSTGNQRGIQFQQQTGPDPPPHHL